MAFTYGEDSSFSYPRQILLDTWRNVHIQLQGVQKLIYTHVYLENKASLF